MLLIVLLLCLLAVLAILFFPRSNSDSESKTLSNHISLTIAGVILVLVGYLFFFAFDVSRASELQFVFSYSWWGDLISFKLGLDGLSLSILFVAALLLPVIIYASKDLEFSDNSPKLYYSMLFLIFFSVFGVLMAQDYLYSFSFGR